MRESIEIVKLAPSRYEVQIVKDDPKFDKSYSIAGEYKTLSIAISTAKRIAKRNGGMIIGRPSTANEKRAAKRIA